MRTNADVKTLNNFLGNRGLATLNETAALFKQMGYLTRDHDHFRQMLTACEPDQRGAMYRSLVPHLRFASKPLDVYIAEAGSIAEQKQLPTIGDDGGVLKPFRPGSIESAEYIAQQALDRALCEFHLVVKCRKCLKQQEFHGIRKIDAITEARNAGWAYDLIGDEGREICPECPGGGK